MSKKEDMINRNFKKCGISLALDVSKNADLNIEGLEDYKMLSVEETYEFQLQRESSSNEEEQEEIWFDLICFYQFWGLKGRFLVSLYSDGLKSGMLVEIKCSKSYTTY